jgi:hypothetical protein
VEGINVITIRFRVSGKKTGKIEQKTTRANFLKN